MKRMNKWKLLSRIICLSAFVVLTKGCIYDNLDGCEVDYSLIVRAFENDSITSSQAVQDVRLFVFDSARCFIQSINTRIGERVKLNALPNQELHIVAWGNLSGGKENCTEPKPGELEDNCFVYLLSETRATSHAISPDDLFRGKIVTRILRGNNEIILPIYRETGTMTITVRNLKSSIGDNDDNYWVMIRDTYSTINFDGSMSGERVTYRPSGSFIMNSGKEEYVVAPFILLPEEGILIDIYHDTDLIATVSNDNDNQPIKVEEGLLTNVLIDLSASVSVSVSLSEWGKVEGWKEF